MKPQGKTKPPKLTFSDGPLPLMYYGAGYQELAKVGAKRFCVAFDGKDLAKISEFFLNRKDCKAFLDSGAFAYLSRVRRNGRSISWDSARDYMARYAECVLRHGSLFDFYVTFDFEPACEVVRRSTLYLNELGVFPVPVYHGDSSLDWLKAYLDDGHQLVCLSRGRYWGRPSVARKAFDQIFRLGEGYHTKFHGLACTGEDMFTYPWYSVDSTIAVFVASKGKVLSFTKRGGLETVYVASGKGGVRGLAQKVGSFGLSVRSLEEVTHARTHYNYLVFEEWLAFKRQNGIIERRESLV